MANGVLGKSWESYRSGVLPADAPQVQIDECRLAFYAGACAAHGPVYAGLTAGRAELTTVLVESIHQEIEAAVGEVRRREPGGLPS